MVQVGVWRSRTRVGLGLLIVLCVPLLAACSSSASTTAGSGGGGTPTATTLPTATATPTPVTTCAQLSGFSGAAALSLPNLTLPDNTVSKAPIPSGGGTGKFTVVEYEACAPNNTAALTVSSGKGPTPFTTLVQFSGWGPVSTFPTDGQVSANCAANSCYLYTDGNQFLLTNVTDHGHGVITFKLLVTSGIAQPSCAAIDFGSADYATTNEDAPGVTIPLPLLTKVGMGQGAAGSTYISMCSAGTEATLTAFFAAAMPAWGWSPNTTVGANAWMQVNSGETWDVEFSGLSTPTNWTLRVHRPI